MKKYMKQFGILPTELPGTMYVSEKTYVNILLCYNPNPQNQIEQTIYKKVDET